MGRKTMKCREIEKRFIPFIDDRLSIRDLECFLRHMDSCPACREEYDVYYTMIMGMRYLESDSPMELRVDSEQKLRYAEDYLLKYKIIFAEKVLCFLLLCFGAVFML